MVWSEILTSFSYALNDLLENSEEIQVEIVEETEAVIDEDSSDENGSDEVSEDIEWIQEVDEEDSKENLDDIVPEIQENEDWMLDEVEEWLDEKVEENVHEMGNDDSDDNVDAQEIDEEDFEENLNEWNVEDKQENKESQDIDGEALWNPILNDDENKEDWDNGEDWNENAEAWNENVEDWNENTEDWDKDKEENNLVENENDEKDGEGAQWEILEESSVEISETQNNEWIVENMSENLETIITKIRYFFKKEWDSRYIKYGRDGNNIGIITLKDPKNSASITIMDKNLGAKVVWVSNGSYGYYFQWWNNHWVETVNSANKTTKKAVYNDGYYNHGYDGRWEFIIWSSDYWENGEHYNSLWWSESKESSRYGACPVGYHIPTIKEWNQLLNIWWNIHTQDNSEGKTTLRYSANYSTRNIHAFKSAATQCEQWDNECVDEDKISSIAEILSSELRLPLAGSYDENGNFHDGLWVYWTSVSKNGNAAWVFDMNAYIWEREDGVLQYKAQGHNIRCFKNVEPYEAPVNLEIQNEESSSNSESMDSLVDESISEWQIWTGIDSQQNWVNLDGSQNIEGNPQDSYPENDILSDNESNPIIQDTTGDSVNKETNTKEYTITWKNEDGSVRDITTVEYGQMPTHEDPVQPSDEKYLYKFTWWDPELKVVEWNAEYKAKYIYIPMEYTVTWKNEDGTIIDTTKVAYGQTPTHANPIQPSDEKYSYKFTWWEPKPSEVKWNTEYRAKYEYIVNKFTITRENEDWTIIDTTEVPYGEIPTHENPIQPSDAHYSYEFSGWNPEISEVKWPVEYRATYKYIVNKYTVIRQNEDWTILETDEEVEYWSIPTYDWEIPVKQSDWIYEYSFEWWNSAVSEVTWDIVYIATYNAEEIGQNIQDVTLETSEWQEDIENDNNSQSWEEELFSPDGWESYLWDNEENIQNSLEESPEWNADNNDSSTNISEWENTIQEWKNLEEGQWLFWWLWKTLKSFFLADEDGYLRWSETIDNIVVNVEAEKWTFPNWTEVIIKWVSQDRLESIQTSLIKDESNNITENAQILAFDISFGYSWEEIQPTKEVSVKFNYKDNLDFQWVSTSQVSVYHIDDETDEGQKVEVANNDGNEIEILTSDFSVYVLALTEDNNIKLRLDPGSWTIITWDNIVVDENGIWTITSVDGNVTLPNAIRENHVFVWWYTSQTSSLQSFAWNWWDQYHVNADITLYAKWCNNWYAINTNKTTCILEWNLKTILDQNPNFIWWEKEIPMPLWWTNEEDPISIVIMDRNLWATAHGTESNAWWYYYQWWNNYGFTQNPQTGAIHIANVNLSLYAPSTYYSGVFLQKVTGNPTDWATTSNYNIWWYYSGTNEAKQWPCPTNWHVPTIEEWRKVVEYWSWNNGWMNVSNFRAELALPLAWWLTRSAATLESGNVAWFYRTVTPNIPSKFAYDFLVRSDSYDVNYSENLVNWRQVRCFKNEDAIVRRYTVTYNDGIDNREIFEDQIFSWLLRWDDFPQFSWQIPWRTGNDWTYHEFLWWFLEWTEIAFNLSGAKVIESVSLYAMWTWCPDGEEPNALGFCVPTAEEQRNRQIVQDLELYLLASDQNKIHYTMMDRNMWATEVFNKYYDAPNPASLGYLYQWWNNYWFPAQWDLAQQWVFIRTSQVPKNIWSVWVPSNYASGTYYSNAGSHASWMGSPSKTDWIWWWTWDTRNANWWNTTLEARQWPCPVWYHVPSTLEWTTIFTDWSWSNIWVSHAKMQNKIEAIYKFSEDLLLPPAWRRGPSWALDYISALSYWSSSPATSDAVRADWLYAKPDDKIEIPNADWRSRARSVRCVKNVVNTSATSISTDDIHLDGWWNAVISIDNWVISTLWTPTRANSTFNGWYTTSDFSWNPLSTWDTVSAWSSLYAKFTCNESWYVWNGTICEDWVRLIFDSMGWTEISSQLIKSGTTWVRPAEPTKTWYVFSGWYLTWETENEFNFTWTIITESTTLYAHWNTWQYEVSIVSNNEDYGTVDSGSIIADFWTPIFTNWNELTIWFTTVIATPATSGEQYTYTFSGWTFENCGTEWSESVTTNCEITANFDRISNGYTVTWNNSDGTTLETDLNVPYGTIPSYDWETPTSGWNAQYSYIFTWWSPAMWIVQWDITYTATYTQSVNAYTVMIQSSDVNSGTVTTWSITVPYGTNISKSGNILEIWNETSTANPNSQTWQYDFAFVDWTDTCGTTVMTWCIVTANFQSILRTYTLDLIIGTWIKTIYYKVNGSDWFINTWITTLLSGIEAWSTIYAYAESKDWYTYTETSVSNPWSVIVTWDNIFAPEAVAGGVQYIVYHYVKKIWSIKYDLVKTDTWVGVTDEILELSWLSKENEFPCAHYVRWSLTWTENWPWEIVTQATIKWDGSTKIYLYYTRNSYTVHLSGDAGIQSLEINENESTEAVRECGSEVPVNAKPKPWYHFVRWDRIERNESEWESETSGEW